MSCDCPICTRSRLWNKAKRKKDWKLADKIYNDLFTELEVLVTDIEMAIVNRKEKKDCLGK